MELMTPELISCLLCGSFGAVCGAAIQWLLEERHGNHARNPFSHWLDRECWVRPCARETWRRHVIIAVSHKGAICVRERARQDQKGYWIKKENVPQRMRFSIGKDGEES